MKFRYIKVSDLYNLAIFFLLFMLIISSASIWVLNDVNIIPAKPLRYSIWTLTIILILFKIKYFPKNKVNYFYFTFLCLLGYSLTNYRYENGFLSTIFIPLLLFYIFACVNASNNLMICNKFVDVMCVLSLVSLFFYFLASVFKFIKPTGYLSYHWSWISNVPSFFNLYFEPSPLTEKSINNIIGRYVPTNCGIFPESPMYNFPLCTALGIHRLLLKSNKRFKDVILTMTILTTGSTTGYIFLALLYAYVLFKKYGLKSVIGKLIIGASIVTIGGYIVINLLDKKVDTGSYRVRYDHMIACIQTVRETLFLGSGIGNGSLLELNMEYKQGASIGFFYLFAQGGIFSVLLLLVPMINSFKLALNHHETNILYFTILFFLLVFLTQIVLRNNMWFIVAAVFMNIEYVYIGMMKPLEI